MPNDEHLHRLRKGGRRKKKRKQNAPTLVLPLIGVALGMLFLVWCVISFQTLTGDQYIPAAGASPNVAGSSPFLLNKDAIRRVPDFDKNNNNNNSNNNGLLQLQPYQSPLLIFTCSRANYLTETLDNILQHIPTACRMGCPIVVTQDQDDVAVTETIERFKRKFEAKGVPFFHIRHDAASPNLRGNAYQKLAVHYGWALRTLFDGKAYEQYPLPERVIILEEDLRIAPDFFDYFEATAPLLDKDPNLLAVSAFNDNGYEGTVADPKRLLRSDFFPGLGWMMTRKTWIEDIGVKWPNGYWDDWLREPAQRQDRQFIRPEITRTFHFGDKGGASRNQFGGNHHRIMLNKDPVDWNAQDLSYLEDKTFAQNYATLVANAQVAGSPQEALPIVKGGRNARVEYTDKGHFARTAQRLNLMTDEKAMIYRTAYKGVVETRPFGQSLLFLTPPLKALKANFGNAWPNE